MSKFKEPSPLMIDVEQPCPVVTERGPVPLRVADATPYTPMSNGEAPTATRKISTTPPPISANSPGERSLSVLPLEPTGILEKKFFPTETDSLAAALVDYFQAPQMMEREERIFLRNGEERVNKILEPRPIPLLSEFAHANGMTLRELQDRAEEDPDLARAITLSKEVLKEYLIRGGLTERYNSSFAQFVAVNETDMRSKANDARIETLDVNRLLDQIENAKRPNERVVVADAKVVR